MYKFGRLFVLMPKSQNGGLAASEINNFKIVRRWQATSGEPEQKTKTKTKEKSMKKKPEHSLSFVQNVFRGIIEPEQVFPYPEVLDAEQRENLEVLVPMAEKVLVEVNDPLLNDKLGEVPEETTQQLKELGAFGLQVPLDYGGAGMTNTQYARFSEIIGSTDLGLGIFVGAHQSIGFKGILLVGTEAQKEKYLPDLAAGQTIAAFALTEPSAGSDAGSVKSRAELSADGKHWILNGSKIWISNGGIADIFTVFARTPVLDEKTGTTKDKVTAFIVERSFGGLTHGAPENKMGIKCSNTAEVYFENVPIPVENVLGGVGNGFKVAMAILNNGRFGMGATLSGTMRHIIKQAAEFATARPQFGSTIDQYGAIQEKLARMSMIHYATESMAYHVSGTMDRGYQDYHIEAAISKIFASEAAWFTCDEAIQICGGMGYMRDTGLEKFMRDLRIFRIFEGTNDILRLFVALVGIQYAGAHLKELQRAVKDPIHNFGFVMGEVSKRAKVGIGIGPGNMLADHVHANLVEPAALASDATKMFGKAVEKLLIKHGKHIIHEQFLLKRIADATIDIYAMACILSRCTKSLAEGLESARHEEMMTKVFCSEASSRVAANLEMITDPTALDNFKNMAKISQGVASRNDVVQGNPIGV